MHVYSHNPAVYIEFCAFCSVVTLLTGDKDVLLKVQNISQFEAGKDYQKSKHPPEEGPH